MHLLDTRPGRLAAEYVGDVIEAARGERVAEAKRLSRIARARSCSGAGAVQVALIVRTRARLLRLLATSGWLGSSAFSRIARARSCSLRASVRVVQPAENEGEVIKAASGLRVLGAHACFEDCKGPLMEYSGAG